VNEEQITTEAPQEESSLVKIGGIVLGIIILLVVLGYAITPIRQSVISWFQEREEAAKLEELKEFAETQPQGDLTRGGKFNAINQ
tara:strand:- start:216473 stop:216727 length:255 start_codon:yes stop_codon:yes gene_type:complete